MTMLVTGGTGTVGSHVVRELLDRREDVRVLTRTTEGVHKLPTGAEGVIGNLLDPETVRSVFRGIDAVFLLNAVSPTETHEGLMAVNGARRAGVGRLVYLSVHQVEQAPHLPHFGSKIAIEAAIRASGVPYTILRPNSFFQNDLLFKDALLEYGVYPQPVGDVGMSRVDVRDIAEAAAVTLTSNAYNGETFNLVGPDVATGSSLAEGWSRALGKPIAYGGDDLNRWEQQSLEYLPAWMAFDLKLMYAFIQDNGLTASAGDIEQQTSLVGHPPRSFTAFAAETATMWKAA